MLAIPNVISFVLLLFAVYFARKRNIRAHKFMVFLTMITSFVLVYMFAEMRLQGGSLVDKERLASFSIWFKFFLGSHILAATVTFLISIIVVTLGLCQNRKVWHKRVAYLLVPIWAYSAISGVAVYVMVGSPDESPTVLESLVSPRDLGEFELQSNSRGSFTHENLKGKWSLLTFGYTFCPDICPMTLSDLNQVTRGIQESLQVLFITADPKRDKADLLEKYVRQFNSEFMDLRSESSVEEILSHRLGAKIVLEENFKSEHYSVFHPTGVYLIAPDGKVLGFYRHPIDVKKTRDDLKHIIAEYGKHFEVRDLKVIEPIKGASVTAAYANFYNNSQFPMQIVEIRSPSFKSVEMHNTVERDGTIGMTKQPILNIPPMSSVTFSPGGLHLMLFEPLNLIKIKNKVEFQFLTGDGFLFHSTATVIDRTDL